MLNQIRAGWYFTYVIIAVVRYYCNVIHTPWWRHQMETFSALLAICVGNSPVTGEFPTQRPVTRSFDVFFDLRLNKRLSKHSWGWWFETLSRPLWRHYSDSCYNMISCSIMVWYKVNIITIFGSHDLLFSSQNILRFLRNMQNDDQFVQIPVCFRWDCETAVKWEN